MKKKLFLAFFIFNTFFVFSHPHMFIDCKVDFSFSENSLEGFFITWYFDDYFASSILMDFDLDKNLYLDKDEIIDIRDNAFINLKNYNFYLYVFDGVKNSTISKVSNFSANWENNKLSYKFFVPYKVNISSKKSEVRVACYDKVFFCDIMFLEKAPISYSAPKNISVKYFVQQNTETKISYDNTNQTNARKNKEFSGVTSPYEAVISFYKKSKGE